MELRRAGAITATRATGAGGSRPLVTATTYTSENIRPFIPQRQPPPSHPPPQVPALQPTAALRLKPTQQAASSVDPPLRNFPALLPLDIDGAPSSTPPTARIAASDAIGSKSRKLHDTPTSTSPRSDEGTLRNQEWLPKLNDLRTPLDFDPNMPMISPTPPPPALQLPRRSSEQIPPSPSTPKSRRRPVSSSSSEDSDETDDGGTLWEKGSKPSLTPLRTNFKGDDAWLVRPTPEVVYDCLEAFFPGHNLDEPMIDAGSGSSSPTAVEPSSAFPPNQPMRDNKHRKSIRGIADERKNKLKQMLKSSFSTKADSKAQAGLRRRSTKLWGSRVEELPMHAQAEDIPPVPELPSSVNINKRKSDTRVIHMPIGIDNLSIIFSATFKWVKGDLIGKGTFGRVYLALNATTGEMMAVKQVEIPRTKSDQDDSRQRSVVEALKAESDTLSKLDHAHVVQYLGLEETPDFLSMSVGSPLQIFFY